MAFFDDGTANGGYMQSRRQIYSEISRISQLLDEENGKREELLLEIARTDRAIERLREVISDMEAEL